MTAQHNSKTSVSSHTTRTYIPVSIQAYTALPCTQMKTQGRKHSCVVHRRDCCKMCLQSDEILVTARTCHSQVVDAIPCHYASVQHRTGCGLQLIQVSEDAEGTGTSLVQPARLHHPAPSITRLSSWPNKTQPSCYTPAFLTSWIMHAADIAPVQMQRLPHVAAACDAGIVCRPDTLHWHHCTVLAAPEAHHKQASRPTSHNTQPSKQAGTHHPTKQASRHTAASQASIHTTPKQASKQAHSTQPLKQAHSSQASKQAHSR